MLTPYLVCRDAASAIDFYARAFGATERFRMTDPGDGRLGHAELDFGTTPMMLSDEYPDFGAISPDTLGGTAVTLHLAVADVDSATARAASAGATILRQPATQSFGRNGWRRWSIPTATAGCCRRPSKPSAPKTCSAAGPSRAHDRRRVPRNGAGPARHP